MPIVLCLAYAIAADTRLCFSWYSKPRTSSDCDQKPYVYGLRLVGYMQLSTSLAFTPNLTSPSPPNPYPTPLILASACAPPPPPPPRAPSRHGHLLALCLLLLLLLLLQVVLQATAQGSLSQGIYHSFGAAVAEVEVDLITGERQVMGVWISVDAGRSVNPAVDMGQVSGGGGRGGVGVEVEAGGVREGGRGGGGRQGGRGGREGGKAKGVGRSVTPAVELRQVRGGGRRGRDKGGGALEGGHGGAGTQRGRGRGDCFQGDTEKGGGAKGGVGKGREEERCWGGFGRGRGGRKNWLESRNGARGG